MKNTNVKNASAVLDDLLDNSLAAFAEVQRVMPELFDDGSDEDLDHWFPASKVTEFEVERTMAAFSPSPAEGRKKTILVSDEFGTVAQLDATVYLTGSVVIVRKDRDYMALRVINEAGDQVGDPLFHAGDYVDDFVSRSLTDPIDLTPFLQICLPEDDLDA